MEFFGYHTCEKIIWTSGEGSIIKNKIRKQGSHKTHMNNISPTSTLGFFVPRISTLVISCQNCFRLDSNHIIQKVGVLLRYIKSVKYRHGIGLPATCEYQRCGDKTGFNGRTIFDCQHYTVSCIIILRVNDTILPACLYWKEVKYVLKTLTVMNISVYMNGGNKVDHLMQK